MSCISITEKNKFPPAWKAGETLLLAQEVSSIYFVEVDHYNALLKPFIYLNNNFSNKRN